MPNAKQTANAARATHTHTRLRASLPTAAHRCKPACAAASAKPQYEHARWTSRAHAAPETAGSHESAYFDSTTALAAWTRMHTSSAASSTNVATAPARRARASATNRLRESTTCIATSTNVATPSHSCSTPHVTGVTISPTSTQASAASKARATRRLATPNITPSPIRKAMCSPGQAGLQRCRHQA